VLVVESKNVWHVASLGLPFHTLLKMARTSRRPLQGRYRAAFTAFGFPVSVRPGFPLFIALLAFLYPFPLGIWIAVAVAVFTFVHELGHALTARRIGCRAEIALDFMVAYAAYHPPRQLKWHERALIAISGPALQAMASIVFLLGMGIHPFSRESIGSSNAAIAVWWAGLALGAINLVPVLPLDGGAVVASLLDAVTGGRGRHVMVRVSIVVTAAITATLLASGNASFLPILVFLLFMQIQMLRAERIISSLSVDPAGDPQQDSLIADMLLEDGQHQHALSFARHAYTLCPAASTAVVAARACARLNNFSDAGQWLLAAEASSLNLTALGTLLEQSPEFHAMRTSPAFVALCRRVDAHPTY